MKEESMDGQKPWCVETADYYSEESFRETLETGVKLFWEKKDALEELRRTIRDDWTSEVVVDGELKSLADCRGMSEMESVKYSQWHYSESGEVAWAFCSDGSGHVGQVFQIDLPPRPKGGTQ